MAILSTDISYASDNSEPFVINVSGGSITPYDNGDYYIFTDADSNSISIKNGDFKFMRGRKYRIINVGILPEYSFTINANTEININGIPNGLEFTIVRDPNSAFVDIKYQSPDPSFSTMQGSFQVLVNSINGTIYDYYYGNMLVDVSNDFGVSSIYCYYHGYMGGENILKYSDLCNPINRIISINNNTINEGATIGTVVGAFITNDPGDNNTFTYTLHTPGVPFTITENQLLTTEVLDYETQSSYIISVSSNDGSNTMTQTFSIFVNDVNEASTDIHISNNAINEDVAVGAVVGAFTTDDPDSNNTFTYTLNTSGVPFEISGNQLLTTGALDYETQTSYTISISSNDGSNNTETSLLI